jgi:membrane-associated phospholipid phosphatase
MPTYTGATGSLALPDALIKSRESLAYGVSPYWTNPKWTPPRWQSRRKPIADGLPPGEDEDRLVDWQRNVVGFLVQTELLTSVTFVPTGSRSISIADKGGTTIISLSRPPLAHFLQQLSLVESYSELRADRASEIVAQVGPQWSFWSSIVNLNTDRTPRTIELIGHALQFAMLCVMRVKHALACPRPIEYSGLIQPMIQTPGYACLPSGHATEAYMFATIMEHLLMLVGSRNPADQEMQTQIYRQAHRIAENRVVAGLHFPVDSIAGKLLGQRLGRYFVSQCIGSKGSQEATFSGEQVPGEAEPSAGVKYGTDPGTSLGADSKTPTKPNAMLAKAWSLAAKEWR